MTSVYVDGVLTIEVKRKHAYAYNKSGSVIGQWDFETRSDFIDQLYKTGFERDEEDYQHQLAMEEKKRLARLARKAR